ncbi:MAG TPA: hypothetical protein VFC28_00895 [Opitutaceae bacterium]|jgi:hypothetical protein|nr:hypothetical protein [Opitutaceae bacterium]
MKRVEVKLSLAVVAPLLDLIKRMVDDLRGQLAAPHSLQDLDEELGAAWKGELLDDQKEDCHRFLALFDREFFASGMVAFDDHNAESVLRACAAIRLRLRDRELRGLSDDALEGAGVDVAQLDDAVQKAYLCYVFLATLQELIIQHLDSAILEG